LGDPSAAIKQTGELDIYPDFPSISRGYRVKAERVIDGFALRAAYQRMMSDPDEPYLLDIIVRTEENVYPMIPAGGTYRDIIMSDDDLRKDYPTDKQGSDI
jgi:acetolactate synthase I/II/III large subunit